MLIDLQIHSTYSDGYLTPTELASFLSQHGVKIASLTDHNTVGGNDEFKQACKKNNIKPIVGLELHCKLNNKKFGLLWYNLNYRDAELHKLLRLSQQRRRQQMRRILKKLKKYGLKINEEKILDRYNYYIPLNRIIKDVYVQAFNKKQIIGQLKSKNPREDEIINYYFKNRHFGILTESYISFKKIIDLRKRIGGQLILNHPGKYNQLDKNFIAKLKKTGLDGLEVISPHHSIGSVMYAQYLAGIYKLIMTGGSDFHKPEGGHELIQNSYDYFKIDSKNLSGINKIIG